MTTTDVLLIGISLGWVSWGIPWFIGKAISENKNFGTKVTWTYTFLTTDPQVTADISFTARQRLNIHDRWVLTGYGIKRPKRGGLQQLRDLVEELATEAQVKNGWLDARHTEDR